MFIIFAVIWIPDACHRLQTDWKVTQVAISSVNARIFITPIFCNLRRDNQKKKIICQRPSFATDCAFSASPDPQKFSALHAKEFRDFAGANAYSRTHARFGNFASNRHWHEAELSGKMRALGRFAQSDCDWDTATERKNILFTPNHLYSLYPAYSELHVAKCN